MEDAFAPGAPIRVARNRGALFTWEMGTLVEPAGPALVVAMADPGAGWEPGEGVILLSGEGQGRLVAAADFFEATPEGYAFRVLGPWRTLDRRSRPRFPTELRGEIVDLAQDAVYFGRVLDLSTGGLRVAVTEKPAAREVMVELMLFGRRASLPCVVVRTRDTDDGAELHLQFEDLDAAQTALVAGCVDILEFVAIHAEDLEAA